MEKIRREIMKTILLLPLFLIASMFSKPPKGDFEFTMKKLQRTAVVNIVTTKVFACSNYGIVIRQSWSRDTLTLKIIGIDSRQTCDNLPDRARENVEIFGIREKEFTLQFVYENRLNTFHVTFDGESFSVTPERSDFIRSLTM
jgi:hypothetical protein